MQDIKTSDIDNTVDEVDRQHRASFLTNIPEISLQDLMNIAGRYGLENEAQTQNFCKFISLVTNFASPTLALSVETLTAVISIGNNLIIKIQKELKELDEVKNLIESFKQAFVKLVIDTEHNLRMVLPHLEQAVFHMRIMVDAMLPDSNAPLNAQDLLDINYALENMASGIVKLLNQAKSSKEKSNDLDKRITSLKSDIESKITTTESRISYAQVLPILFGTPAGMFT
jgi:hypothetical protein